MNAQTISSTRPTTYAVPGSCYRCSGLGLWLDAHGGVTDCPHLSLEGNWPEPAATAKFLRRSVDSLKRRGIGLDAHLFNIAVYVGASGTSESPVPGDVILDRYFAFSPSNRKRRFYEAIAALRDVWLLPLASRKDSPAGYWIAVDESDYAAWVERQKKGPVTELSMIHRNAKANFPVLAEQLEIDFWNDVDDARRPGKFSELPEANGTGGDNQAPRVGP